MREVLKTLQDILQRVARIETRLMSLAAQLDIDVRRQPQPPL